MKPIIGVTLVTLFTNVIARTQEIDVDISSDGVSIETQHWYENPIVWVGGIVLDFVGELGSWPRAAYFYSGQDQNLKA